jgi:hypothetical protein
MSSAHCATLSAISDRDVPVLIFRADDDQGPSNAGERSTVLPHKQFRRLLPLVGGGKLRPRSSAATDKVYHLICPAISA